MPKTSTATTRKIGVSGERNTGLRFGEMSDALAKPTAATGISMAAVAVNSREHESRSARSGVAQGLGSGNDFHDLGRDRRLTGLVVGKSQRAHEIFRIARRVLHRRHSRSLFGGVGVEQ